MACVQPKDDCPHVQDIELDPDRLNINAPCVDCGDTSENWLCTSCYGVFCSRYVNGHMKKHNTDTRHPVALSYSDLSIWCYECDDYVSQATDNIVYHAHMLKHGCPPGQADVTAEELAQIQNIVSGLSHPAPEVESEKYGKKQKQEDNSNDNSKETSYGNTTTTTTTTTSSYNTFGDNSTTTTSTTSSNALVEVDGLDSAYLQNKVVDRILGCIYGNALGDAVGLATEFMSKADITKAYGNAPLNFPNYKKNHHNSRWTTGDWTDDTDQMILIMETLLETKKADPVVFANKLKTWIKQGFPELGDTAGMGLGATTYRVVQHKTFLTDPIRSSHEVWNQNGRVFAPNGGVMRTSVVGCYHFNSQEEVLANSDLMCQVTHADPRCVASCRAAVIAISSMILEAQRILHLHAPKSDDGLLEDILVEVRKVCRGLLSESVENTRDFEHYLTTESLQSLKLDEEAAIGYTFKAMGSGFWGLRSKLSFAETLELLAKEGGDADTYPV